VVVEEVAIHQLTQPQQVQVAVVAVVVLGLVISKHQQYQAL
jgi:hypothetical protein